MMSPADRGNDKSLQDTVALVTGASRGIGKAISQRLAEDGARVGLLSRDSQALSTVRDAIEAKGGRALVAEADVTQPDQVEDALDRIRDEWGRITVFVSNAGITRDGLLIRLKDEQWDDVLNVNLRAGFQITRTVLRDMLRERRGSIIFLSSVVGVAGNPGQSNYAASKAGLLGLTRSLAKEVSGRQIRVNAVAPGFIDTAMTDDMTDEQRQRILDAIPLQRFGSPEDVAGVVSFLASPRSSYVTGQVIHVNGGFYTGAT